MKRIALMTVAVLVPAALASGPGLCDVALNEIMADPASDWDGDDSYDYRGDEWVEIVNNGPGSLDLEGFLLGDHAGLLCYGLGGTLGPGEALVVYGSQSQAWQSENGYAALGFNLSNDGDTVVLYEVAGPDTIIVDSHTFNTYEADDDRSTGRLPDGTGEWQIFDALNPYSGDTPPLGNGMPPTPGSLNSGPVAVDPTSWGSIKALYDVP